MHAKVAAAFLEQSAKGAVGAVAWVDDLIVCTLVPIEDGAELGLGLGQACLLQVLQKVVVAEHTVHHVLEGRMHCPAELTEGGHLGVTACVLGKVVLPALNAHLVRQRLVDLQLAQLGGDVGKLAAYRSEAVHASVS